MFLIDRFLLKKHVYRPWRVRVLVYSFVFVFTSLLLRHQAQEMQVRKQFHETLKIQSRQYKILQKQKLSQTPRENHRDIIRQFKEDRIRKMADLASQYDESVSELMRKQKACCCFYVLLGVQFCILPLHYGCYLS